ncbi:MAG: flagellin [Hahellaceae bacterium]|nr:flagellin [Hahellaceae bacterium]
MPQIINTNIASLNAQRNLNSSQRANSTALERLSSGLRINSAKDDAAGLAISTRFDSQIRGTGQAIRNSGDAISLAQTAEGALNSMTASLQRVRELALQSANDTNTDIDRQALQEEVDQLVSEIDNISKTTNFNGKKLLDGSFSNSVFQTGANAGDTISVSIGKLATDSLGTAGGAGISAVTGSTTASGSFVGTTTSGQALVSGDLVINGVAVGASVGTSDTSSTHQAASSAIAKAAAINAVSEQSGVVATVDGTTVAGTSSGGTVANVTNATIFINNVQVELGNSTTLTAEQNLQATANAINAKSAQTGVTAVFNGDAANGVSLVAEDGRNIAIGGTAAGITAKFGLASNTAITSTTQAGVTSNSTQDVFVGTFNLSSADGSDIGLTTNTGDIDHAGFEVGTFSGVNSGVVSNGGAMGTTANAGISTGDLVINGVAVGASVSTDDTASSASKSASAISKAAAINKVSDQTGVTAVVNENRINSITDISGTTGGTATINGVSITTSYATGDTVDVKLANIVSAINAKSGQTGVTAEALDADSFTLVAADGRNISLTTGSAFGAVADAADNSTYVGSVTLKAAGTIELSSNTNNIAQSGFKVGSYGSSESGTLLKDIDITTAEGATKAITAIDNAIKTISSKVGELGAVQNRFQNTISNLEVNNENLNAANSRIRDADFAAETAALSKSQVLQQAGVSILAQANARPQQVLSLLG